MRPGHAHMSYGFKPLCPIFGQLEIANYVASLTVTHLSLRPSVSERDTGPCGIIFYHTRSI